MELQLLLAVCRAFTFTLRNGADLMWIDGSFYFQAVEYTSDLEKHIPEHAVNLQIATALPCTPSFACMHNCI